MSQLLPQPVAVIVFLALASAYFLSALVRAATATLAPTLAQEFALQARDLGLLGGGYFLGFAAMQLPLGRWLDHHGPRKVLLGLLGVAVAGCLVFAAATGFFGLLVGRVLCGAGLSACLMAPLTGYRRWFAPQAQMSANSWMLMTGSLGMVAATLPVQWALPLLGWRPLFWAMAALIALAMVVIALRVPGWAGATDGAAAQGYAVVWRHSYFRRLAPLGFFCYGGMMAMQTLWAGPWMQRVAGYTPLESAAGLFGINVAMLCAFWAWGMAYPGLLRKGWGADRLMCLGLPLSLLILLGIIIAGPRAGGGAWALYCVSCTFVSLSQPALALAFPQALAGRALSAFNLVIFSGVFTVQWGIGLAVDAFAAINLPPGLLLPPWQAGGAGAAGANTIAPAFQAAMALYLACNTAAYAWFLLRGQRDNALQARLP